MIDATKGDLVDVVVHRAFMASEWTSCLHYILIPAMAMECASVANSLHPMYMYVQEKETGK